MATFFFDTTAEVATDAPVYAVKTGETGYYPVYTDKTATELNEGRYTEAELKSAKDASMFGWKCPAAQAAVNVGA